MLGLGLGAVPARIPERRCCNGRGLWIAEQKLSGAMAAQFYLPEPKDLSEKAWLVDWNGTLLNEVSTRSRNTSGMAVGGGYVRMCATAPPQGVFQVDMISCDAGIHPGRPNNDSPAAGWIFRIDLS